jgi:hypothetical protein
VKNHDEDYDQEASFRSELYTETDVTRSTF